MNEKCKEQNNAASLGRVGFSFSLYKKGLQREYINSNDVKFYELTLSLQTPSPNKRQ